MLKEMVGDELSVLLIGLARVGPLDALLPGYPKRAGAVDPLRVKGEGRTRSRPLTSGATTVRGMPAQTERCCSR